MKANNMRIAAVLLLIAIALGAKAADVSGTKVDDKVSVDGRELVLNGAGMRSRLIIKVYIAALFLPQKTNTAQAVINSNQPRRIQLIIQREISADQLLEAMRASLADNNSQTDLDAIKGQMEEFAGIVKSLGDAKVGQSIFIDYSPESGTRISLDGAEKGTIAGEPFNKAMLRIWLGNNPVQESLKKALLGA
jgi:long-chain acyl-CoA synthetase